jgi:thiol:disulfide interchange protein DsbD
MAIIYAFLGVLAGLTGKVFGTLTNTPGWYIGLGAIISLAALTMLDVISFDPQMMWEGFKRKLGLTSKVPAHSHSSHGQPMSLMGAFGLGASSGFIAAPCTTPVLTTILAYIAKTQSIGLGLVLMLAFSAGLGTILLVVAAFAGALQSLPRSGQWMNTIKKASGLILLIFGEYLIYRAGALGGL